MTAQLHWQHALCGGVPAVLLPYISGPLSRNVRSANP